MANEVCFRTLEYLKQPWELEEYKSRGGYEVLTHILKNKIEQIGRASCRERVEIHVGTVQVNTEA